MTCPNSAIQSMTIVRNTTDRNVYNEPSNWLYKAYACDFTIKSFEICGTDESTFYKQHMTAKTGFPSKLTFLYY